jgi:hypothetical protein
MTDNMNNDMYIKMLETSLKHVSMYADRADKLAYAIQGLLEGDDPEDAAQLLHEFGYTDESGFWIDE